MPCARLQRRAWPPPEQNSHQSCRCSAPCGAALCDAPPCGRAAPRGFFIPPLSPARSTQHAVHGSLGARPTCPGPGQRTAPRSVAPQAGCTHPGRVAWGSAVGMLPPLAWWAPATPTCTTLADFPGRPASCCSAATTWTPYCTAAAPLIALYNTASASMSTGGTARALVMGTHQRGGRGERVPARCMRHADPGCAAAKCEQAEDPGALQPPTHSN